MSEREYFLFEREAAPRRPTANGKPPTKPNLGIAAAANVDIDPIRLDRPKRPTIRERTDANRLVLSGFRPKVGQDLLAVPLTRGPNIRAKGFFLSPPSKPALVALGQTNTRFLSTIGKFGTVLRVESQLPTDPWPTGREPAARDVAIRAIGPEEAQALAESGDANDIWAPPVIPVRLILRSEAASPAADGSPWGIKAIGADRSSYLGNGPCVAILDTGIDTAHPAFSRFEFVTDGPENRINYKDFTGTGFADRDGHGTHCAGIVFGGDVDGQRIGVATGVRNVLIAKIADPATATTTRHLHKAIAWVMQRGAHVVSMSIGLDFSRHARNLMADAASPDAGLAEALDDYLVYGRFFDRLIDLYTGDQGEGGSSAVFIAASGNDSQSDTGPTGHRVMPLLPAAADGVISVGSVGSVADGLCVDRTSNGPPSVCAPGVGILSARSKDASGTGLLTTKSGTSQAAPHVAGAAALWWQQMKLQDKKEPTGKRLGDKLKGHALTDPLLPPNALADRGEGMVATPGAK